MKQSYTKVAAEEVWGNKITDGFFFENFDRDPSFILYASPVC